MATTGRTRYRAVDNGYEIIGSREMFNRTLYGSHRNDDKPERYFTFAGDLPVFMGAVTDWSKNSWGNYAKNGVLMSGLALTPGLRIASVVSPDVDHGSHWFHDAEDVVAVFRGGWMTYDLRQISPYMPDARIHVEAFPLLPEDGFLISYRITTNQRAIFCLGFGGVTDFLGRLENWRVKARNFGAADCAGNVVTIGANRALLSRPGGDALWIGASFPVAVEAADAAALQNGAPGSFLKSKPDGAAPQAVRMSRAIGAGETLEGFVVVVRNEDEGVLDKWLGLGDPVGHLKRQIYQKRAAISLHSPDAELNLTVPPTVTALDASWHKNSFHHGAHAYHAPFLGWRNWYGPTVLGWHDRVRSTIKAHFAEAAPKTAAKEEVWYDGGPRPDLDHEGSQYHHLKNSHGRVPCLLGRDDIYNMQEVAVDMLFHQLQWHGDLALGRDVFAAVEAALDWEERILDPDHDGLYQNFLNTWISDGHSYNGGGCAQASAYNHAANLMMAKLAAKLGLPGGRFKDRAEKILAAVTATLWLPEQGVMAEFVDTIGNKLVHPSPELSTIYLSIDCGLVDMFQAYQALRFTETALRNERTLDRKGRLVYSSNWYPKKYSTCGLFPAENLHLALAYFQTGLKGKALEILDAVVDSYFTGKNPGMACHVLTGHGVSDGGDQDFTDVSSMYLRTVVEGLFGVRFHLLDDLVEIAPGFPSTWTHAKLMLKDISLSYSRDGHEESLTVHRETEAKVKFKLPLRSTSVEEVLLNGDPTRYVVDPGVGTCFLVVESDKPGFLHLRVFHGGEEIPALACPTKTFAGNKLAIEASKGEIVACRDGSGALADVAIIDNKLVATVKAESGDHTVFVKVVDDQFDAWLPADFVVQKIEVKPVPGDASSFEPLDISKHFNCSLQEIHAQEYRTPRPEGYSIGVRLNGRYAWDWNQGGHNAVEVDDRGLRDAGGLFRTPSGIGFLTPEAGPNVVCASIWDNFPTVVEIPLAGKAAELALLLVGVTNPMQCWVENARLTVIYGDGSRQTGVLGQPRELRRLAQRHGADAKRGGVFQRPQPRHSPEGRPRPSQGADGGRGGGRRQ